MMTSTQITNMEDLIDGRDVIARIEVLSALRQAGPVDLGSDEDNDADQDGLFYELASLERLAREAADYSDDWEFGSTLIRDSYFVEYAQELAEELVPDGTDMSWPYRCIDWQQAARELQQDYTSVDFDGITYWIR